MAFNLQPLEHLMKREMDVVRAIILAVKDSVGPIDGIPGIAPDVYAYHAQLFRGGWYGRSGPYA